MEADGKTNDAYFDVYLPLLRENLAPPLAVVGGSMTPYLINGRDAVGLCPLCTDDRLHIGDICLYRRDTGAYILHRIVGKRQETYTFAGDGQTLREYGIQREQIIARVVFVVRRGKTEKGGFWWYFFCSIWILVLPWRRWILHTYEKMRNLHGFRPTR